MMDRPDLKLDGLSVAEYRQLLELPKHILDVLEDNLLLMGIEDLAAEIGDDTSFINIDHMALKRTLQRIFGR